MPINRRKSRVQPKPAAKKSYTKKAVDAAYREVQTKMRKEVTKLQKIKSPFHLTAAANKKITGSVITGKPLSHDRATGLKKMADIGMQGRAKRTKAISAAAKKHGVPKSQITALNPINPGEVARKMKSGFIKKYGR
jgi:hypothetical protein|tara:strand:+ start:143 stop:550 length:408 start_codon:yes stop_codon:yes gene_type:complete